MDGFELRVTATATATAAGNSVFAGIDSSSAVRAESYNGSNKQYCLWGLRAEIGTVATTYVSTTSTAVYGTPSLSFSGVAGLGLQSDGSLYVSPAGTGAIRQSYYIICNRW
jgi:hypothetical protein